MQFIDKNDVDISKLFHWGKKFPIVDGNGETIMEIFIRVVGDSEINRARVQALRASAELRKKLKTDGTDERTAYLPDFEFIETENLIEMVIANGLREISNRATKNLELNLPQEPKSDATLEEQEKYQQIVDNWPEERKKIIEAKIYEEIEKERAKLVTKTREEVQHAYETQVINEMCEEEMYKTFFEYCVFYGAYVDAEYTTRLFNNYEDFSSLPLFVKEQFVHHYTSLDITIDELKK